jgi:hypothetical protein
MAQTQANLDEVVQLAKGLSPADQLRLVERLLPGLETKVETVNKKPLRSSYGALRDLGPAPSAEDIDEVRREMWRNLPRDDIG